MTAADPAAVGTALGAEAEFAPAKLNLFLHLRGRRADGYHLLESLVVFPDLGDRLWAEPSHALSLTLSGPFGDMLPADGDNLVLRAAERLAAASGAAPRAALTLEKTLPIASGIGGGSSDAAAALRLLSRLWGVAVPDGLALSLGADVPVCLAPRATVMEGIGERLAPAPRLPEAWVVLVNPLVTVATGMVFSACETTDCPPAPAPPPGGLARFADLTDWLARCRNDLEAPAIRCCPPIGEVLAALSDAPIARMSGSGATCFALWPDEAAAMAGAEAIRRARPGWWVAAAPIRSNPGLV